MKREALNSSFATSLFSVVIFQETDSGSHFGPQIVRFDLPYFLSRHDLVGKLALGLHGTSQVTFSKFSLCCMEHFKLEGFQKPLNILDKIKNMCQKQQ